MKTIIASLIMLSCTSVFSQSLLEGNNTASFVSSKDFQDGHMRKVGALNKKGDLVYVEVLDSEDMTCVTMPTEANFDETLLCEEGYENNHAPQADRFLLNIKSITANKSYLEVLYLDSHPWGQINKFQNGEGREELLKKSISLSFIVDKN
ncbi:MAG: hypothetical protein CME63_04325 [Halobacteriovoraceae bacterium]|nr:hypothetical protein [Halobacteriovoraceae bacterium]|tara:strand:+ start:247428 stop:247877 length:450 start_codon:yes stop_codon:yes gene_type:complete